MNHFLYLTFCSKRREKTAYKKASERVHALHEGNAGASGCGVHTEGERGH